MLRTKINKKDNAENKKKQHHNSEQNFPVIKSVLALPWYYHTRTDTVLTFDFSRNYITRLDIT